MVTLRGRVEARVKVVACIDHPDVRVMHQEATNAPLIPYHLADMNVVVLIGLLRWRLGMKRSEVKAFLHSRGLDLSEGTISNRSLDFLLLFAQLHRDRHEKIKKALARQGGTVLHMDGTHKSGGRVTFVLQEDRHGIIVDAALVPSEGEEHVGKVLASYKEMYGSPLVVVRDMSDSLAAAATNVFPGVRQQICQVHFLRNIERTLLSGPHTTLKRLIVRHRLTPRLRGLRVADAGGERSIGDLERLWVHVAVDYLLHPVKQQTKWLSAPLPYFFQHHRVAEVSKLVQRLVRWNASRNCVCNAVMDLDLCLREVLQDRDVRNAFNLVRRTIHWLDMARVPLRISRTTHLKDTPPDGRGIEEVKVMLRAVLDRITREGREIGGEYHRVASAVRKSFDEHWDELFVPFPMVKGKPVRFRRHNNALEQSHRWTRKGIRERTGRERTRLEMEQFGDLLAILSNLWNPAYQRLVLDDVRDLSQALGQHIPDLPRLRTEYRLARSGPERPTPDGERLDVLQDFLQALEASSDDEDLISRLLDIVGVEADDFAVC